MSTIVPNGSNGTRRSSMLLDGAQQSSQSSRYWSSSFPSPAPNSLNSPSQANDWTQDSQVPRDPSRNFRSSNKPSLAFPNTQSSPKIQDDAGGFHYDQIRANFLPYQSFNSFNQAQASFLPNPSTTVKPQRWANNVTVTPYTFQQNGGAPKQQQPSHDGIYHCWFNKCTFSCNEHWRFTRHLDKEHSLGTDILGFEPEKGKTFWDGRKFVTKEEQMINASAGAVGDRPFGNQTNAFHQPPDPFSFRPTRMGTPPAMNPLMKNQLPYTRKVKSMEHMQMIHKGSIHRGPMH